MKFIEELSMNATPALQTQVYDGWILRFAKGYGNRANSINPIYKSNFNVNEKIDTCNKIYTTMGLKPVYKISPFVNPVCLDKLLENRNFKKIHLTSLQVLSLDNITFEPMTNVIFFETFNDFWFDNFVRLNGSTKKNIHIYKEMLQNLVSKSIFFLLTVDKTPVACLAAIFENSYVGLFDIAVASDYRKLGYASELINKTLNFSKNLGSKYSYLQVMPKNKPAYNLYSKLGFKEIYQYYYRVGEI